MEPFGKTHYIAINPSGSFHNTGSERLSTPEDVDQLFAELRSSKRNLAIYLHGGLVDLKDGLEATERFHEFYGGSSHTVGLAWSTGFWTSLVSCIDDVAKHAMFGQVRDKVAQYSLRAVAPNKQGNNKVLGQNTPDFDEAIVALERTGANFPLLLFPTKGRVGPPVRNTQLLAQCTRIAEQNLDPNDRIAYNLEQKAPTQKALGGFLVFTTIVKIVARVLFRKYKGRFHGWSGTILEEVYRELLADLHIDSLPRELWAQMKKQARGLWQPHGRRTGSSQIAGTYFLERLDKHIQWMRSLELPFEVDLVAHSAGSIAVAEMFQAILSRPGDFGHVKLRNLILLAPACRTKLFVESIIPHVGSQGKLAQRFRMFTMQTDYELKDRLINSAIAGWVYPSSLLYFVSALCEPSDANGGHKLRSEDALGDVCILGLHQQMATTAPYGRFTVLKDMNRFLNDATDGPRLVLTPTEPNAPQGCRGQAVDHGEFDNDGEDPLKVSESIRSSVCHLLKGK